MKEQIVAVIAPRIEDYRRFCRVVNPGGKVNTRFVQHSGHFRNAEIIEAVMVGNPRAMPWLGALFQHCRDLVKERT